MKKAMALMLSLVMAIIHWRACTTGGTDGRRQHAGGSADKLQEQKSGFRRRRKDTVDICLSESIRSPLVRFVSRNPVTRR